MYSNAHVPYLLSDRGRAKYAIVALLNSSEAAAQRAIEHYKLPSTTKAYGSPVELAANPDIDLVVCTTRVDVHYDTIRPSIEAGKNVFVEWPLAENVTRASELADLAQQKGSKTIIGLQGRVAPAVLKLREILEQGELGKVLSSSAQAYTLLARRDAISEGLAYFLDRKVGGNPITIAVAHTIDYIHSVLGEFESSSALTQIQRPEKTIDDPETGKKRLYTTDVPDLLALHGTLRRSSLVQEGASLTLNFRLGPPFPGSTPFIWTINCEKGEIRISSARGPFLQASSSDFPIPIEVHFHDSDEVKTVEWQWEEWQESLPAVGRSIAKLYDLYSEERLEEVSNATFVSAKRKVGEALDSGPDTSRPSAVFKPAGSRTFTLTLALPGSIIANALTHDQKTSLAGQIARACAVFCVDEIVVFDDGQAETRAPEQGGYTAFADPNFFLYHVLTYLETPPNLRKPLFPMHPDLRTAGALPSLDMPHHLRSEEWCEYREGIALQTGKGKNPETLVDCGLAQRVAVPAAIEPHTRVTVKLGETSPDGYTISGQAVAPETPREEAGYYWGYSVRQASSLSAIFTECPFDGGYDLSIGTSERGKPLKSILDKQSPAYVEPTWEHLIVVFGGVSGLEPALKADRELQSAGVRQAEEVFDSWINLVPNQGSRTIRTEEAVWVGLTGLREAIDARSVR
ncbi:putative methyltransferase C9orf114 [Cercospora zeina]